MQPGLTVRVSELDDDYVAVEIVAATKRFSGKTLLYFSSEALLTFADDLDGFPQIGSDVRLVELGEKYAPRSASGYCFLRFHCLDCTGKAAVDVDIRDSAFRFGDGSARFRIAPFVGGSVDAFVAELRQVAKGRSDEARLVASED